MQKALLTVEVDGDDLEDAAQTLKQDIAARIGNLSNIDVLSMEPSGESWTASLCGPVDTMHILAMTFEFPLAA